MEEMGLLEKLILKRLIRARIWGGKHIPLDFVIKGVPEHYRNTPKGKKAVEKALKELTNKERKVSEIKTFLAEELVP